MKTLVTDRLILREWSLLDVDDMFAYAKLDTVGPSAGWEPHKTRQDTMEILKRFIAQNDTWALVLKKTGKVIGSVGIHDFIDLNGKRVKTLGYVLSTAYEGQGLMTEACRKAIQYVFEEMDIEMIEVSHFLDNHKSERVIEKLGFSFVKIADYSTFSHGVKQSKYYRLTKNEYTKKENERV